MELPDWLREALLREAGVQALSAQPVRGGMICQAARVVTPDGVAFVKWSEQAPASLFDDERDGLEAIREARALRVPEVVAWGARPGADLGGYLVLEYIQCAAPSDMAAFGKRFGELLAALHRAPAPGRGRYGYHRGNHLGMMAQRNEWCEEWWRFYCDSRIAPQAEQARSRGLLPAARSTLLGKVLDSMEELLGGVPREPALVHGDLWSGNLMCCGGEPVVIDPAVHVAHREVELAYIELFGGFPPCWREAYEQRYPVDAGYVQRRPLLQLYPLLVHLNHFGETYGQHVEEVCRAALQ